jgi:DNA invertase Pin-like site-specific DNA recombinase
VIPGKHPGGRPRVLVEPELVDRLRRQRLSWRRIAKALGIGTATAMRLYNAGQQVRKASQNSPLEVGRG